MDVAEILPEVDIDGLGGLAVYGWCSCDGADCTPESRHVVIICRFIISDKRR